MVIECVMTTDGQDGQAGPGRPDWPSVWIVVVTGLVAAYSGMGSWHDEQRMAQAEVLNQALGDALRVRQQVEVNMNHPGRDRCAALPLVQGSGAELSCDQGRVRIRVPGRGGDAPVTLLLTPMSQSDGHIRWRCEAASAVNLEAVPPPCWP